MIEIRHRRSGRSFLSVDADTLERANLAGEYLIHADLAHANLRGAQLPFANLSGADMRGADLAGANLRGAVLIEADLNGADLVGAILSGATLSLTVLVGCPSLHRAVGLDQVRHQGPSMLDRVTLSAGGGVLSDSFLRGAGLTGGEIAAIRAEFASE